MKTKFLIPILFLFFIGCEKEKIEELPGNITALKPIENLVDSLKAVFSENGNFVRNNAVLFSDTIQKKIILVNESSVFVTFIDENTDKKNTLCWYTYNKSQPPLNNSDIIGNILFPNISKIGDGGLLELGYTVQLGSEKFPAGTVIGFFLVAGGWNDGAINYNNNTFYTNNNLNSSGQQMHVFFKNKYSHYLIMGIEDNLNPPSDFNDVLFSVSDNKEGHESTSFDLTKVFVK